MSINRNLAAAVLGVFCLVASVLVASQASDPIQVDVDYPMQVTPATNTGAQLGPGTGFVTSCG